MVKSIGLAIAVLAGVLAAGTAFGHASQQAERDAIWKAKVSDTYCGGYFLKKVDIAVAAIKEIKARKGTWDKDRWTSMDILLFGYDKVAVTTALQVQKEVSKGKFKSETDMLYRALTLCEKNLVSPGGGGECATG